MTAAALTDRPPRPGPRLTTADAPLVYGRLHTFRTVRGPVLAIFVLCPHCRRRHVHTWHADAEGAHHRRGHCEGWLEGERLRLCWLGYFIQPKADATNREVVREYRRLLAARRSGDGANE